MQKEYLSFLSILPLSNGGSHFKIIFFRSFFWEMGGMGKARNGVGGSWFYNGGDGKFLKSLQIVGRRVLTTLFYEDPPIFPTLVFQILSNPFPVTSNLHSHCSFCYG